MPRSFCRLVGTGLKAIRSLTLGARSYRPQHNCRVHPWQLCQPEPREPISPCITNAAGRTFGRAEHSAAEAHLEVRLECAVLHAAVPGELAAAVLANVVVVEHLAAPAATLLRSASVHACVCCSTRGSACACVPLPRQKRRACRMRGMRAACEACALCKSIRAGGKAAALGALLLQSVQGDRKRKKEPSARGQSIQCAPRCGRGEREGRTC